MRLDLERFLLAFVAQNFDPKPGCDEAALKRCLLGHIAAIAKAGEREGRRGAASVVAQAQADGIFPRLTVRALEGQ